MEFESRLKNIERFHFFQYSFRCQRSIMQVNILSSNETPESGAHHLGTRADANIAAVGRQVRPDLAVQASTLLNVR